MEYLGTAQRSKSVSIRLIQEVRPVEGVALLGDESCFADHPPQVFFGGRVARACLADHIFLKHHAPYVVPAEA